jgi:hypothetical protein
MSPSSAARRRVIQQVEPSMGKAVHPVVDVPETDDDHRRVLAVVTFLEAR